MSGGSWNYLYSLADDVEGYATTFKRVAGRLAAAETVNSLEAAREASLIAEELKSAVGRWLGLWDVLHAMEWEDSCDSSPPALANAIDRWVAARRAP